MSFSTPVDVSACTTASSTRAADAAACASSSRCGSIARPHGSSTRTTSAPQRRATSHMRSPNTPFTPMIAVSPGSSRLTKHASIPAEPVPLIGSVSAFAVWNTARSRSAISSSTTRKSGSRWPRTGRWNASITSGYGFDGPGPEQQPIGVRSARPTTTGEAVEDVGFRHEQLVEVEVAHHRHDDDRAADDHVDAARFEAGVVAPLRRSARSRACGTHPRPPRASGGSGGCARSRTRRRRARRPPSSRPCRRYRSASSRSRPRAARGSRRRGGRARPTPPGSAPRRAGGSPWRNAR